MLKIFQAAQGLSLEASRFAGNQYPAFTYAPSPAALGQRVPVFMFHTIEAETFRAQLEFLRSNGYATLTLDAFFAFLSGRQRLAGPSVLLTFDDGDRSWFDVALPLLREFGCHAAGFLVTHFISEAPGSPWLSWPEIREMEASGAFTFESHSHRHGRVFVGPQLVDFFRPDYTPNPLELEIPWHGGGTETSNRLEWGTPVYAHRSRFAGHPRFLDDPAVRAACVNHVTSAGGPRFFQNPAWRRELTKIFKGARPDTPSATYETAEETRAALLEDLASSREVLSHRLGRPALHLCYPWGIGSPLSVEVSRGAGFESNFWVSHPGVNITQAGLDPFSIPRLKDDFLFRLPGAGRESLIHLVERKLRRRRLKRYIY